MERFDHRNSGIRRASQTILVGVVVAGLAACVTPPPPRPPPPPPPMVNTTVYAYPMHGQSAEQLDRDRYDCYVWAKQQTGFDPGSASVPPEERVRVVSGPPPGTGTAVGAVTGAVVGAAISNPWSRGFGALAGALVGGAIGSSVDASRAQQTQETVVYDRAQLAQIRAQAANYRRAMSACLEGRGYTVQ
ncbi:MAG TPA: glycine zipper 2TM domain-containing protein [Steroidobacteraceae bacterium]|nr:glycine zipper 2TM domain-containing protein [Steroidobacteraceae bacterium]